MVRTHDTSWDPITVTPTLNIALDACIVPSQVRLLSPPLTTYMRCGLHAQRAKPLWGKTLAVCLPMLTCLHVVQAAGGARVDTAHVLVLDGLIDEPIREVGLLWGWQQ
jgi:hypothetical protein